LLFKNFKSTKKKLLDSFLFFSFEFFMMLLLFFILSIFPVSCYWINVPASPSTYSYVSVSWINSTTVLAVGNSLSGGAVIRSMNRGLTWTQMSISGGNRFFDISATNIKGKTYALTVDDLGQIFLSLNYGTSWTKKATLTGVRMLSVCIGSNGYSFISGQSNKIYRASNTSSYATWTNLSPTIPGTKGYFWGIGSMDGIHVITVGDYGYVYYSSNAGATFAAGASGTNVSIYTISNGNNTVAMAAGASNFVAITYNNGMTWKTLNPFTVGGITSQYHTVSMLNTREAFIAGYVSTKSYIYMTVDGGNSWRVQAEVSKVIYSLSMYDSLTGSAGAVAGAGFYTLIRGLFLFL
jgi:photosystem II stability/assembly factor-like uncharacterized protein